MKNILVPFDHSIDALNGLKSAANFSKRFGGKINLIYFLIADSSHTNKADYDSTKASTESTTNSVDQQAKILIQALNQAMSNYIDDKERRGSIYVINDKITNVWSQVLEERSPDLIISGIPDTHHLLDYLTETVTETIIRNAEIPVITVSNTSDMKLNNILLATDVGRIIPEKMIDICRTFSKHGAQVHFATILNVETLSKKQVNQKMQLLAKEYRIDNYQIHIRTDVDILKGLSEISQVVNPDLVMLKTYEKNAFWQVMAPSVAENINDLNSKPTMIQKVSRH